MAERQKRQRDVGRVHVEHRLGGEQVGNQVAVREHDALRLAGRPRRVDDRGELLGTHGARRIAEFPRGAPLGNHPRMAPLAYRRQGDDRGGASSVPVDHENGFEQRQLMADLLKLLELLAVRDHRQPRAAILEDVAHLRRRQRGIDGHGHRAGGQDRQVGQQPLGSAVGNDGDAIARPNAKRAQTERQISQSVEPVPRRLTMDPVRRCTPDQERLGVSAGNMKRKISHRRELGSGLHGR